MTAIPDAPKFPSAPHARHCSPRMRRGERSGPVELLELAAVTIPFRSEIMELPLVALTMLFCFAALVVLGRWWER